MAQHLDRPVVLADVVANDLDAVAAKVDDRPAAGQSAVPEPRRVRAGMGFAGAHPGDVADGSRAHCLDRLERLGRVAQVLEVAAEHARLFDRLEHPSRLVGVAAERLGAQHRLAGCGGQRDCLLVQKVGQPDNDYVSVGMLDRGTHVGRRFRNVPALLEGAATLGAARVHDADGVAAALAVQGHRVEVADQPRAEHGDLVLFHRVLLIGRVAGVRVSGVVTGPILGSRYDRAMSTSNPSATSNATIVVPGIGRVVVEPDIASVRLGVLVVGATATGAREAAAATMNAVLAAVAGQDIARRDMQTALLSLNPVTDYSPESGPRVTGYQVANSVSITVRDLAKTGNVIDAGLGAGATSMDGLEFRLEDPREGGVAARKLAVEDATKRAQTLASSADIKLGGVVGIVEGDRQAIPFLANGGMRAMAMKAEAADTPVESGSQEISVSVVVTFAIE